MTSARTKSKCQTVSLRARIEAPTAILFIDGQRYSFRSVCQPHAVSIPVYRIGGAA